MFNIINFRTLCNKVTGSSNIIHSILIYKLMGRVIILRLHREQKKAKTENSKKLSKKVQLSKKIEQQKSLKKRIFQKNFFYFQLIF